MSGQTFTALFVKVLDDFSDFVVVVAFLLDIKSAFLLRSLSNTASYLHVIHVGSNFHLD